MSADLCEGACECVDEMLDLLRLCPPLHLMPPLVGVVALGRLLVPALLLLLFPTTTDEERVWPCAVGGTASTLALDPMPIDWLLLCTARWARALVVELAVKAARKSNLLLL